jgi:hypothetical protein
MRTSKRPKQQWPRIRNLPKKEQLAFAEFLYGQTQPWMPNIDPANQDAYYAHDYAKWKSLGKGKIKEHHLSCD